MSETPKTTAALMSGHCGDSNRFRKRSDMQKLPVFRVGEGHDVHRTAAGRQLILGNIRVDCEFGLDGHSDADVLLHAVIDALLGATGRGDIGEWFPNTSAEWKDADSADMLTHVWQSLAADGWQIQNLDCTISAEKPHLGPWKPIIRERVAQLLGLSAEQVNVKAKSGEAVGPVGRGDAITADAVVLLAGKPKT
jgi:2-C-methyl-D-erythritol 2,4-cyclodiphosphate synthase